MCQYTENEILVPVVVDGQLSDEETDAISVAGNEVMADFPPHIAVFFKLELCDSPTHITHDTHEIAVYERLEQ
jgi:hypothetical protein